MREGCKMHMIESKLSQGIHTSVLNIFYLFLFICGRSFSSEDTETRVASETFSRQLCMVFPNYTQSSEIGIAGLTMFGARKSLSFCQWWTFCDRAFLGMLTFRFHQWNVLSGSSSCFVHLVFCSFWNSSLFISRYGFTSQAYHSLINFWKGPPMMRSIQLTAKLVSSSSINKRCRRVFHNEVQTLEQLFSTIMQGIQAYPLTSLRDQSNK